MTNIIKRVTPRTTPLLKGELINACIFIGYVGKGYKNANIGRFKCGDCGAEFDKIVSFVITGRVKNCGCIRKNKGKLAKEYRGVEYNSWQSAKRRCYGNDEYHAPYYKDKGIKMCERWLHSFENFLEDMGRRPGKGYTLDRINPDKDYCLENCRWTTIKEQNNNKTNHRYVTIDGETKNVAQWSAISGIRHNLILGRLKRKWDERDAVFKPISINHSVNKQTKKKA